MARKRFVKTLALVLLATGIVLGLQQDCNISSVFLEYVDDPDNAFKLFAPSSFLHDGFLIAFTVGCCGEFGGTVWAGSDLLDDFNMRWDITALLYHISNPQENLVHEVRGVDWEEYDPCGVTGTNWPTPDHFDIDGFHEVILQGYEEVEVGILDPENLVEDFPYWVTTTWDKTTEFAGLAEFFSESELTGLSPFGTGSVWHPLGFDELGYIVNTWQDPDCFGGYGCQ